MFKAVTIAFLLLAASVASAQTGTGFPKSALEIESGDQRHRFTIELAETPEQKARGLMFRRSMAPDAGMLFDYGAPREISMWMKNTYLPLDMVFIGAKGRIVEIVERTVPLSLTQIAPSEPARAVLELNAGTASRLGLKPGDRVIHELYGAPPKPAP
jgi:uncharacterized membrane protein (UPF0127 family)